MSDAAGAAAPAVSRQAEMVAQRHRDALIGRDLDDVYLLLDYLSGRADRGISSLKIADVGKEGKTVWLIEAICGIRWPPDQTDSLAQDATILFKARDQLNQIAHPASSVSIAFTIMVTNLVGDRPSDPPPPPSGGSGGGGGEVLGSARTELAERAYPDLIAPARRLRGWIRRYLWFLLIGLAVTAPLSWNVASGKLILERVNQLKLRAASEAAHMVGAIQSVGEANAIPAADAPDAAATYDGMCGDGAANQAKPFASSLRHDEFCGEAQAIHMQRRAADMELQNWYEFWDGLLSAGHLTGEPLRPLKLDDNEDYRTMVAKAAHIEQRAGDVDTIMTAYVLPMLYGFLGATAAVIRSLHSKMRESTLTPRDIRTSQVQLALGIIVGACIGLFVSPSGVPDTQLPAIALAGAGVSLSASALSFIAGFGVEAVFKWLETVITVAFAATGSASQPPRPLNHPQ